MIIERHLMTLTQEFDTIAAISTPLGEGAIAIVRLSGTDALKIAQSVYKGKNLTQVASHTINYGHIFEEKRLVDEVMVSVMRAPKTFTREDIVEINTHGGIAVTQEILQFPKTAISLIPITPATLPTRTAHPGRF